MGARLGVSRPRAPRAGASRPSPQSCGDVEGTWRGPALGQRCHSRLAELNRQFLRRAGRPPCVHRAQRLAAERRRLRAAAFVYGGTEMINAGIIPARPPTPFCPLHFGRPATRGGTGGLHCRRGSPRAAPRPAADTGVPLLLVPGPGCPRRARDCPPDPAQPGLRPSLLPSSSVGAPEGCGAAAS